MTCDVKMWIARGVRERLSFNVHRHVDNVLAKLSEYGVSATFFITGKVAEKHPEIPAKVRKGDHEIASHSYAHGDFSEVSYEAAEEDLVRSLTVLGGYQEIRGFRAPFLVRNQATYQACEDLGLDYDSSEYGLVKYRPESFRVTVIPVVSPLDTHGLDLLRRRPDQLVADWMAECDQSVGAAIGMHVWRVGRKNYVETILEPLLESGLTFVRAHELLSKDGIALTFDIEYTSLGEALPQNVGLLRSPGWKHPESLQARAFVKD
ncbi:MAG: polysaccharide deacetylase family protein [Candidatus Bathyarchaeota archaeon]|nr:polysaccharide deacetylase family protein [Candidatus Bathyarchaeota archaeon]